MEILYTKRLILKPYTLDDAQGLFSYASNPDVGPPAGWSPHKSVEESENIIKELFLPAKAWSIRLKNCDKIIGTISLETDKHRPESNSKEMGYSLAFEYWGQGIMTEAANRVLEYGFLVLKLSQIGICTGAANKRSQGVIKNCGFVYEGTIRKSYKIYDGTLRDSLIFSILKEEWESRREK